MKYEMMVSDDRDYIIFRAHEPMTIEIGRRYGPELVKLATENGINRFLFDVRGSENIESVTDNYYFANKDITDFRFPRASRSAFLISENDRSHDFITTVFLNAGYIVKQFCDEDAARRWLKEGTKRA